MEAVEERGREGSSRDRNISFTLTSNCKDGAPRINAFIDAALAHYRMLQTARRDNSRYLFMPFQHAKESDPVDSESKNTMIYKRYRLSDEKTFKCYFSEKKASLLRLVDHFLGKTGKFAIEGYPHKLGILLHGPPGTGKTSLIKALAHYTGRSIVSVPLTKVKTNQELMDIMFDQRFLVQGEDLPMRLPNSKVFVLSIYVFIYGMPARSTFS
jgi:mitochondrial chaperone BCS1